MRHRLLRAGEGTGLQAGVYASTTWYRKRVDYNTLRSRYTHLERPLRRLLQPHRLRYVAGHQNSPHQRLQRRAGRQHQLYRVKETKHPVSGASLTGVFLSYCPVFVHKLVAEYTSANGGEAWGYVCGHTEQDEPEKTGSRGGVLRAGGVQRHAGAVHQYPDGGGGCPGEPYRERTGHPDMVYRLRTGGGRRVHYGG